MVFSKHPRALSTLFFAEMWERFSFYGMKALLVLYLTLDLRLGREEALSLYGAYLGLVYLTPLLGGWLADRWLGAANATLAGGALIALGHFTLAHPQGLYLALGFLIAGEGLFKPSVTALLGNLYPEGDARRETGFTIFYMGINIGAFLAPLVCGGIAAWLGWHAGFAVAGIGMALGLAVFVQGMSRQGERLDMGKAAWAAGAGAGAVLFLFALFRAWQKGPLVAAFLAAFMIAALIYFLRPHLTFAASGLIAEKKPEKKPLAPQEKDRLWVLAALMLANFWYWLCAEQGAGTMTLFAQEKVSRVIFGKEFPASFFQSVNPLCIIVLAPLLSGVWSRMPRFSAIHKQAAGLWLLALGFVLMEALARLASLGPVPAGSLFLVYVVITIGEVVLYPVGLAAVGRLAPSANQGLALGAWFLATAAAGYGAGIAEPLLQESPFPLYGFLAAVAAILGALLWLFSARLVKKAHGVI